MEDPQLSGMQGPFSRGVVLLQGHRLTSRSPWSPGAVGRPPLGAFGLRLAVFLSF